MLQNETIKTLTTRFTCRDYDPRPLTDEELETVLTAATYAASGRNAQGWHFTVIKRGSESADLAVRSLGKNPPPGFPPSMTWPRDSDFYNAPVLIIVSYDPTCPFPEAAGHLAAANIMTAAQSLGLSTMWSTTFTNDMFRDEEIAKRKSEFMPEGYKVQAALFVGQPRKAPGERPPRKENVVTYMK